MASRGMSFANFDYEAQSVPADANKRQNSGSLQDKSTNEVDNIIHKTSGQLQLFGDLILQLETQKKQIGSKRDSSELRSIMEHTILKLSRLEGSIRVVVDHFNQLTTKSTIENTDRSKSKLDINKKQSLLKERLINEFNELSFLFQKTVNQYKEKSRQNPMGEQQLRKVDENTSLLEGDTIAGREQIQKQQQIDALDESELQYHLNLTELRNRDINQINEGIVEINSIFKDLGQLVLQQGEQVDTVEENILYLQSNAQQAGRELKRAHEYQKRKSKWSCIILIFFIVVLVIILAVIS